MKRLLVSIAVVLTGCGGGGSSSDDVTNPDYPPVTYSTFGGLRWSSTTQQQVLNPAGLAVTLEMTARAYCTQQTCDQGGGNCRYTNFNGEAGWRLPTLDELRAYRAASPTPPGWVIGRVWTNGQIALDFGTGQVVGTGQGATAHVTCVKPV